jgi:flavin-dependent thymidylate synthase
MKVILAGFNIEADQVRRIRGKGREVLTPEVISAAYARISRDPRNINTLRKEARKEVVKARKSNERIIFGLGHASVAEHAVFNFDIMGISRLAVEELERFRIASFTEKSQRYIRLERDLVIPQEIRSVKLERDFSRLAKRLHRFYEELLEKILERGGTEEAAREDARYLMPLATSAQLGMTVNARELEYIISKLSAHPLDELRTLARKLSTHTRRVAPSLVRYPEPTDYLLDAPSARGEIARLVTPPLPGAAGSAANVRLIEVTPDGDTRLAATLVFSSLNVTFGEAYEIAKNLPAAQKRMIVAKTMRSMQSHESVWREFENIHLLFELIVSSSCFAQLKRHRMTTLISQPYDVRLGISVPGSVRTARGVGMLREAAASSERLHRLLERRMTAAACYTLINAHRRRVLLGLNLRELYHFSRLRSDRHAQWEIRRVSDEMCRLAARSLPTGTLLLCGKDTFEERKQTLES